MLPPNTKHCCGKLRHATTDLATYYPRQPPTSPAQLFNRIYPVDRPTTKQPADHRPQSTKNRLINSLDTAATRVAKLKRCHILKWVHNHRLVLLSLCYSLKDYSWAVTITSLWCFLDEDYRAILSLTTALYGYTEPLSERLLFFRISWILSKWYCWALPLRQHKKCRHD